MKKLKHTATYRDGGSKQYEGDDGNEYWKLLRFPSNLNPNFGKIFTHYPNHPNTELAKGTFQIEEEIITQ